MRSALGYLSCACAAVLACARATAAPAGPELAAFSLEQLMEMNVSEVYGASKYRQRITQAPSSISIVTAEDIRRFGYRTLSDVLRGIRGVYVANDHAYPFIGLRGFMRPGDYTTRILVLIDGHRMNDNVFDGGSPGRDALPDIGLVERVEVIRGPSSSVYGSSAFFGVINIITKRGTDFSGSEVSVAAGNRDTYEVRSTSAGSVPDGLDWLLSASGYSSAGDRHAYFSEFDQRISSDPRARNDGVAQGLDDEGTAKLYGSLRYGNFSATAYYSDRAKQIPTASYGSLFNDSGERSLDGRSYLELNYKQLLSSHAELQWRSFVDRSTTRGSSAYDYAAPGDPFNRVVFRIAALGEWAGTEALLTLRPNDRYTLLAGTEYRYNFHEDERAFDDIEPRFYYLDYSHSSDVLGVFAQAEVRLRNDLSVTAGVRHDRYGGDVGSTTNPRTAVIYNPTATSALKAIYGRAFRAPNPFERYSFGSEQANHAALQPETIDTYELVYERELGANHRISLSAYAYDIHGLLTQATVPDFVPTDPPQYYYANLQDVRARGVELEWEGTFDSGTLVQGSVSAQRSEDGSNDEELSNSPRRMAKLRAMQPFLGQQLFAGVEVQYMSKTLTVVRTHAPSVVLTNLTLNARGLWDRFELNAGIYNLFDKAHWVPAAEEHAQSMLRQAGRTYMGRLTMRFN